MAPLYLYMAPVKGVSRLIVGKELGEKVAESGRRLRTPLRRVLADGDSLAVMMCETLS